MKKELVIEMEEECITCPFLSLVTKTLCIRDKHYKTHECEHMSMCKEIRKNWEQYQPNCDECDREEPGPFGRSNY